MKCSPSHHQQCNGKLNFGAPACLNLYSSNSLKSARIMGSQVSFQVGSSKTTFPAPEKCVESQFKTSFFISASLSLAFLLHGRFVSG
eukprot:Skav214256  [mRNA]  locus=scaffold2045:482295:485438:+ [translate_table: standard]